MEAVAISPIRSVAGAIAVSSTVSSNAPEGRRPTSLNSAGLSAKKIESNVPRSAIRASSR
ncbi:hypothetical protein GCM10023317_00360 [Actinopolymorpha pittospori]